ncbi:DUF3037 domain-containing protein [Flavisolibacter ginsenosidimutans]|uniref:DUF3037 domain-containing protein n=1 Tax=Flavisolibacter ginsenosidimutans TaxID=661481 RepID=A0A5B8UCW5_9BACT|nr:DUF3037 domain-containing protein [Flavisolibacter ginsenosidimutans]QEC54501.1 DUF3037 domain-containing protein [Flavisolibacter ginsenosidimutans]
MPDKRLFEYAVIRVVPRVEREEFLNVGIILYCKQKKYLNCVYKLDQKRLNVLCPTLECGDVEDHLLSFESICKGSKEAGSIGSLDLSSRFRWLTATRSTIVQTSKVHPGFCKDPDETLQKLFEQLVL